MAITSGAVRACIHVRRRCSAGSASLLIAVLSAAPLHGCGDNPGESTKDKDPQQDAGCRTNCELDEDDDEDLPNRRDGGPKGDAGIDAGPTEVWAEGYTFLLTDRADDGRRILQFLPTSGLPAYRVSDDVIATDIEDGRLSVDGTKVLYFAHSGTSALIDLVKLGPTQLSVRTRVATTSAPDSSGRDVSIVDFNGTFRLAYLDDEAPDAAGGDSLFVVDFDSANLPAPRVRAHAALQAGQSVSSMAFVRPDALVFHADLGELPAYYFHRIVPGAGTPSTTRISPDTAASDGASDGMVTCGDAPSVVFPMSLGAAPEDDLVPSPRQLVTVSTAGDTPGPALTISPNAGNYLIDETVCSRDSSVFALQKAAGIFLARTSASAVDARFALASPWSANPAEYTLTAALTHSGQNLFIVATSTVDLHSDLWFSSLVSGTPTTPTLVARLAGGVSAMDGQHNGHLVVDRNRERVYVVRENAQGLAQAGAVDVVDGAPKLVDIGGTLPGKQQVVRFVCTKPWEKCFGVTATVSYEQAGIELWSIDPRLDAPLPTHLASNALLFAGNINMHLADDDRAMIVNGVLQDGTTRNYLIDLLSADPVFGLIDGENLSPAFRVTDLHRVAP